MVQRLCRHFLCETATSRHDVLGEIPTAVKYHAVVFASESFFGPKSSVKTNGTGGAQAAADEVREV